MASAISTQGALAGPPSDRLSQIETLRGIAATMVFVCHAMAFTLFVEEGTLAWRLAVWFGYLGVAVFFVISGFVLYRPFLIARERGTHVSTISYLARRAFRIFPLYWVVLVIFCRVEGFAGLDSHT